MAPGFTRHPANPVIPVVPGTWRNYVTANADIILWKDEWRLYFRGNCEHEGGVVNGYIGLMTCPVDEFDGVTWTEYVGNPITAPGEPGSIDDMGAIDPSVLVVDDRFLLYYTAVPLPGTEPESHRLTSPGRPWGQAGKCIALADSDDGLKFVRTRPDPVLPRFAAAPEVVFHEGEYWLFYSGYDERGGTDIYVVRSADPYRFDHTRRQIALSAGLRGAGSRTP